MTIQINDPHALLNQVANAVQIGNNISYAQDELLLLCNQIANAWQSDTEDKESYLSSLNTTLTSLSSLAENLKALCKTLEGYAHKQIQNSQNV